MADAYADGVNHYAALHPEHVLPGVVPVLGRDVVAGFTFRTPFFYGLERAVRPLFDEEQAPSLAAWWRAPEYALGSNAIAVAPSRAADGATRLLVNSHQPYTGPVAWYEVAPPQRERLGHDGRRLPRLAGRAARGEPRRSAGRPP